MKNETLSIFKDFLVAYEFRPNTFDEMEPEKILARIQKYQERDVEWVEITDNYGGAPSLPGIYTADIIGPLMRKIVRYTILDRSIKVFVSDMMHAVSVGVESVLLTFGNLGTGLKEVQKLCRVTPLQDGKGIKEHILIGAEVRSIQITDDNINRLKEAGIDYIQTEPIFCDDRLYKIVELVHKLDMPLVVGVDYPREESELQMMVKLHSEISEGYVKSFDGLNHKGVFLSNAIANAVRFIKLCQANVDGVHILALPEHLGYFEGLTNGVEQAGK